MGPRPWSVIGPNVEGEEGWRDPQTSLEPYTVRESLVRRGPGEQDRVSKIIVELRSRICLRLLTSDLYGRRVHEAYLFPVRRVWVFRTGSLGGLVWGLDDAGIRTGRVTVEVGGSMCPVLGPEEEVKREELGCRSVSPLE